MTADGNGWLSLDDLMLGWLDSTLQRGAARLRARESHPATAPGARVTIDGARVSGWDSAAGPGRLA